VLGHVDVQAAVSYRAMLLNDIWVQCAVWLGLARAVYIHCIWLHFWWFSCQKYRIYNVYIHMVLADPLYEERKWHEECKRHKERNWHEERKWMSACWGTRTYRLRWATGQCCWTTFGCSVLYEKCANDMKNANDMKSANEWVRAGACVLAGCVETLGLHCCSHKGRKTNIKTTAFLACHTS
jgi:hypothetical protein